MNNDKTSVRWFLPLLALLLLTGCASQPSNVNDACIIFQEKGGWFNNWYKATDRAQKKYGVPKAIILATLKQESAFRAHAKPPRRRLLGFIPWTRPSNAYGYSQALVSTWDSYRKSSGNGGADRDDFADSVDFVGWYYNRSYQLNGVALNDAYHLYLTYYFGHGGYGRGVWRKRADVQRIAWRVSGQAERYTQQMRGCGYKP
jgi:hypothetical protein